jgi:hypothetical protein
MKNISMDFNTNNVNDFIEIAISLNNEYVTIYNLERDSQKVFEITYRS